MDTKPEDKYVVINDLRLHYLDWGGLDRSGPDRNEPTGDGGKPPMLLLHGFMGHAHVWDDFALSFRGRYRVIALDQRGHGESDWSPTLAYGIDDHFADISRFVEALGLQRMVLIGHSMGGRNALFYAAARPERIERLILVDSRPAETETSSNALLELLLHLPLEADAVEEVAEVFRSLYPFLPPGTAYRIARDGYMRTGGGKFVPRCDIRMGLQCQSPGFRTEDLWPFIGHISCPTLVVRGEGSPFLSREDARRMAEFLPRGSLREISRATHLPVQENAEEFNAAVRDYLAATL